MSFLLFLRGMIVVLVVFAITTYYVTQSFWSAVVQTLICAVLLQIGYFAAVLFLVWRQAGRKNGETEEPKGETAQAPVQDDQPTAKVGELPGVPRPR